MKRLRASRPAPGPDVHESGWLDGEVELGAGDTVELEILAGPLEGQTFGVPVRSLRGAWLRGAPLGGAMGPAPGTPVRLGLRAGGRFFAARTHVAEQIRHSAATVLLGVPVPEGLEPLDQRSYFRLPTAIAPERAVLSGPEGRIALRAIITNVSGGGAELAASRAAMLGAQVDLDFALGPLAVVGRSRVRAAQRPTRADRPTGCTANSSDLERGLRERIVRYVFNTQRDLLRRGLLGGAP